MEKCQYGQLAHEMIHDRLVLGISDKALSKRLFMNAELTLEKAKTMIRQREAVHEQRDMPENNGSTKHTTSVDQVNSKNIRHTSHRTAIAQPKLPGNLRFATQKCERCGSKPHPRDQCLFKQAECYKYKRKDILVISALL